MDLWIRVWLDRSDMLIGIEFRRIRRISGTMLQFLPVVKEEAAVMGAEGEAGDDAAAAA